MLGRLISLVGGRTPSVSPTPSNPPGTPTRTEVRQDYTFPENSVFASGSRTDELYDNGDMTPGTQTPVQATKRLSEEVRFRSGLKLLHDAVKQTLTIAMTNGTTHVLDGVNLQVSEDLAWIAIGRDSGQYHEGDGVRQAIRADGSYIYTPGRRAGHTEAPGQINVGADGRATVQYLVSGSNTERWVPETPDGALYVNWNPGNHGYGPTRHVPFVLHRHLKPSDACSDSAAQS